MVISCEMLESSAWIMVFICAHSGHWSNKCSTGMMAVPNLGRTLVKMAGSIVLKLQFPNGEQMELDEIILAPKNYNTCKNKTL